MDHKLEFSVGVFILRVCFPCLWLCVSRVGFQHRQNLGNRTICQYRTLKPRAPLKLWCSHWTCFKNLIESRPVYPTVALNIDAQYNSLPETSSAAILTSGLLGEQYISITWIC